MKAIADWVVAIAAALAAPFLYAQLGGYLVSAQGMSLPESASSFSQYVHADWLYFIVVPLFVLGHFALWALMKDTAPRFRVTAGAAAQGVTWAALAGAVTLLAMFFDVSSAGYPMPTSSMIAEMMGPQLALLAASVFAVLGALSGALTGAASLEFVAPEPG